MTTDLLRAFGLGSTVISRWVAAGFLHRVYRGVYAVGHPALSLNGRWLAAVYACGRGAVLSHLAAACLWRLLEWDESWPIDVTVPTANGRSHREGIRLHRSSTLSGRDTTERDSIPVTNVPRILSDLPQVASPADFREACRKAEIKGHRKGLPKDHVPNRSDLELAMYALCEKHGLPTPKTRVRIDTYEADFLFGERVIIETDGWETHGTRQAFEDDREREIELALLGYEVHRITWRQIVNRPDWVAASLATILNRTG